MRIFAMMTSLLAVSLSLYAQEPLQDVIERGFSRAAGQALFMADRLKEQSGQLPRTLNNQGSLRTTDCYWWCSGFYPGVLWYLYENTQNEKLASAAREFTDRLEPVQFVTDNHDVGFMLYCSYGNGQRLGEQKDRYKRILVTGAYSLAKRYSDRIGLIRSWDFNPERWQYPVIIDNMMNLELMLWAARETKDKRLKEIALNHADNTLRHHFRADNSCYHVVSYDTLTSLPEKKETWQGYSDESAWARGQGWALYGYTFMYRETGKSRYLKHAKAIADYIYNHPRLPEDGIPYWDFDAPQIPHALRDASAGSLICSALIELSEFVNKKDAERYLDLAEKQLRSLTSSAYLAEPETSEGFILKHSVGFFGQNSEIDVPLTYADYYYVEALGRMKRKVCP